MMRELAPLAALGLILVPDGASAFFGRRFVRCQPPPVPVYFCPPVVLAPPCLPYFEMAPVYPVAPQAEAVPVPATPAPATPAAEKPKTPRVSVEPAGESVKPAAVAESTPRRVAPPVAATPAVASPGFTVPELKPALPSAPAAGLTIPATSVPGGGKPAEVPKVVADKPAAPLHLQPANGADGLPPLSLPDAGCIARSSPIHARPAYELFPMSATLPEGATVREVDFTNLTGRDLTVTVEGKSVALPDRSSLRVSVPARFHWQLDDGREVESEVPAGAAGADVVLRR